MTDVADAAQIELEPSVGVDADAGGRAAVGAAAAPEKGALRKSADVAVSMSATLVKALTLAFAIRIIAFEPFHIPSESMEPTLFTGDIVAAAKFP